MNVKFTARRFRVRSDVKEHAIESARKLGRFYDGIVSAEIILSIECATKSVRVAEMNLRVHGSLLSATEKSEDFIKSIDAAADKLSLRLMKYKTKLRMKDKTKVRAIREKV